MLGLTEPLSRFSDRFFDITLCNTVSLHEQDEDWIGEQFLKRRLDAASCPDVVRFQYPLHEPAAQTLLQAL
jgi:hypothetical protein